MNDEPLARCSNCGLPAAIAKMWRDPRSGLLECLDCDGVNWSSKADRALLRRRDARLGKQLRPAWKPTKPRAA